MLEKTIVNQLLRIRNADVNSCSGLKLMFGEQLGLDLQDYSFFVLDHPGMRSVNPDVVFVKK
jgi:hypothetical protein